MSTSISVTLDHLFFVKSFVRLPGVFFLDHLLFFDVMLASPKWTSYGTPVTKETNVNSIEKLKP